jgi:flavin reductase (DIM6/NTAB) family NADH-FMN oxidoreductase RutF
MTENSSSGDRDGGGEIDPKEFRKVMGQFATGVTVVTTRTPDGRPHGLTANAFMSVSLDPPLVVVSIDKKADTHKYIRDSGVFCVNILKEDHQHISEKFASKDPDKFEGIAHADIHTGAPVFDDALAWIDCEVVDEFEGGDHTLFLGKVTALEHRGGKPLLFFSGKYRKLPDSEDAD